MDGNYTINLNDYVRVKLTDLGKDIFYHQFDKAIRLGARIKPTMPKTDADGYTKIQLWQFIELYGEYVGMGKPNVIEPLDLVFDSKVLKQLSAFPANEE